MNWFQKGNCHCHMVLFEVANNTRILTLADQVQFMPLSTSTFIFFASLFVRMFLSFLRRETHKCTCHMNWNGEYKNNSMKRQHYLFQIILLLNFFRYFSREFTHMKLCNIFFNFKILRLVLRLKLSVYVRLYAQVNTKNTFLSVCTNIHVIFTFFFTENRYGERQGRNLVFTLAVLPGSFL